MLLLLLVFTLSNASLRTEKDVEYYVISRGDPLHYEKLNGSLEDTPGFIRTDNDRPVVPTVVLLHGLRGSHVTDCNTKIAKGLIERGGLNIIVADYQPAVGGPEYAIAAKNVDIVGRIIGESLLSWQRDGAIALKTTTLIGFSLGAHVAGVAGYYIRENSAYLRRIIGLDPAKPEFINAPTERKLDRTDAGYVMVLHTAGGFLAIDDPIGHADFYPNGGKEIQPLCLDESKLSSLICSHNAACAYLAESIMRPDFLAVKCNSWSDFQQDLCSMNTKAYMGFDSDDSTEGTFFLKTGRKPPYGFHEEDTFVKTSTNGVLKNENDLDVYRYYGAGTSVSRGIKLTAPFVYTVCIVVCRKFY